VFSADIASRWPAVGGTHSSAPHVAWGITRSGWAAEPDVAVTDEGLHARWPRRGPVR